MRLTWTDQGTAVAGYDVRRSSLPYFEPDDSESVLLGHVLQPTGDTAPTYLDAGGSTPPGSSYFYAIVPVHPGGDQYESSNQAGALNFALLRP